MTLEEQLNDLERQIQDIRLCRDVVLAESLRKRVLQNTIFAGITSTSLTDINETTNVPAGGGSVTHAEAFDRKVLVNIDGSNYFIGLYDA